MPLWRFNLLLGCIHLADYAMAQSQAAATHTITVGLEGSFYNPPFVTAAKNDTVTFVFAGDLHGVTQCDSTTPCVAKLGGFNSGLAGRQGNYSQPPPTWDLKILDDSQPIWFFCPAVSPASQCNAGMVGVINPLSVEDYNHFVDLAKVLTGTQPPTPAVTLTGFGAVALNSPAVTTPVSSLPLSTSSTLIPSSTFPSSTFSPPPTITPTTDSSTSSAQSSRSNVAAIVGGTIGGIAFLGLAGILTFLALRHRKNSRRASRDFFEYQTRAPVHAEGDRSGATLPIPRWRFNFLPSSPSTRTRLLDSGRPAEPGASFGSTTGVSSQDYERS